MTGSTDAGAPGFALYGEMRLQVCGVSRTLPKLVSGFAASSLPAHVTVRTYRTLQMLPRCAALPETRCVHGAAVPVMSPFCTFFKKFTIRSLYTK